MLRSSKFIVLGLLLCASLAQAQSIGPAPGGGSPSGAAGGVLSGTYPNPGYATQPMVPANNLSDVSSATTSRTNLGLGTAATQNTGTSGANVPLLNGTNTWSGIQSIIMGTGTGPDLEVAITGDTNSRVAIGVNTSDVARVSFGPGNAVRDLFLERVAGAGLRYGAPDAAAPVAQTQSTQNVVAGTSNTAGATWTFKGSQGTGTGVGGSIIFQVAPAGSTGTAQNALANALTIDSTKLLTVPGAVAIGGATPGTNALAVTGTANISGFITSPSTGAATTMSMGPDANSGIGFFNSSVYFRSFSAQSALITSSQFRLPSTSFFAFDTGVNITGGADTTLSRNAAGIVQFGTTAANALGSWLATNGTLSGSLTLGTSGILVGGTNAIDMRNGVNAQTFNLYTAYTDASNYARLRIYGQSGADLSIYAERAGSSSAATLNLGAYNDVYFWTGSSLTARWRIDGTAGHLFAVTDNTYDIGASGATRPRTLYLGTSFVTPKGTITAGTLGDQLQAFSLTATQPASPTGTQKAVTWTVTGAGSASQENSAFALTLAAGYTGSKIATTARIVNLTATSGLGLFVGLADNFPTTGAGLVVDNGALAVDILRLNDNGTAVVIVADGGKVTMTSLTTASGTPNSICQNDSTKEITVNAALSCTVSGREFKYNINPLKVAASDLIRAIEPVSFIYRGSTRTRYGFIAEQVASVDRKFGDAWMVDGPKSIDQNAILATTVLALQEAFGRIDKLERTPR